MRQNEWKNCPLFVRLSKLYMDDGHAYLFFISKWSKTGQFLSMFYKLS